MMAFSNDRATMAVSHSPSAVGLVNPESGQAFAELEAQNPQLMSWLRFSPDGNQLAVVCSTHVIQLWDLRRIRQQLAAMGLDWNARRDPPAGADAHVSIQVEIDRGILALFHGGL